MDVRKKRWIMITRPVPVKLLGTRDRCRVAWEAGVRPKAAP